MKSTFLPMTAQNDNKRLVLGIGLMVAMTFLHQRAAATISTIDLGTASTFAVLAGSGIVNAGMTTINGDVGSSPTATITGFGTVILNGTNYGGDPTTVNAKRDLSDAYADAAGRLPTTIFPPISDLGGLTLTNGIYYDPSSFSISGTLTLDAQGDPHAVWIFQAGSTLSTTANSSVILIGGAQSANVFWQVGSSATLGANAGFAGNILAFTSITMDTGTVDGRLLAMGGAVSLSADTITVPAAPVLNFYRYENEIVLFWPINAAGFTLECTTDLTTGHWLPNASSPSVVDGQYTVTNTMSNGAEFYRLVK